MASVFVVINRCSKRMFVETSNNNNQTKKVERKLINNSGDLREIITGLTKVGYDWSGFPLSENFLGQYNSEDGIFSEYEGYFHISWSTNLDLRNEEINITNDKFDVEYSIEWFLDPDRDAGRGDYYRLIDVNVTYLINNKGEIDDLIKGDPKIIYEDGYLNKEYDKSITADNCFGILTDILFYDKNSINSVYAGDRPPMERLPVTSKLLSKVVRNKFDRPFFNNFFGDVEFQIGGIRKQINETKQKAFENRCCYAVCEIYDEDIDLSMVLSGDDETSIPIKEYLYKLTFQLDNNNLLDDFVLEYLGEYSNDVIKSNYNYIYE